MNDTPQEPADTIAVMLSLASDNIPPDIQELLTVGNPRFHIKPGALWRAIAAMPALAAAYQRGRLAGREEAAKLMEGFPERVLHMWDRPGGPPGNGYAATTNRDRAEAIRSLPQEGG